MTFKPRSINEYPRDISSNCIIFSLGICESIPKSTKKYNLDHNLPISEAFVKKVTELGFKEPRQIQTLEELKEGEYAFWVFDFTPRTIRYPFVGPVTFHDFHVMRRELDGTWVHKPGWDEPPCVVDNWEELYKEFGRKYVLFAM